MDSLPDELRALLQLVHVEGNADIPNLDDHFDWNIFLEFVLHHRLFPGLASNLKKTSAAEIPEITYSQLQNWHHSNTFQMLHLTAEMERLNRCLYDNHIPVLFLKGPVLAKALYSDLSLRTSSDLDLLVPMNQLENVEELLKEMGYLKDDYIESVLNDWKWRHHHITFYHHEKKVKCEVHWRLNPGPGKEPNFNSLWKRRQSLTFTEFPICYLGNEELFFFLVTHGARHGWSRLRWLVDIDRLIKKQLDWMQVKALFKKYHHLSLAGQALLLANQLLDTKIQEATQVIALNPKSWRLANDALFYMKRMIHLHNDPVPEDVSHYHKQHLISLMSFQQKALFYLSFLFPFPEDAQYLSLPKKLHFLYFPLRPFIWMMRKRKSRVARGVRG